MCLAVNIYWQSFVQTKTSAPASRGQTEHVVSYSTGMHSCWATVCKTVRSMLPVRCLSCLSVTFVHCGQTAGWITMKLGTKVGLGSGHIALDGDPALLPQRGTTPQFSAHVYCGQTVAHLSYCWALVLFLQILALCYLGAILTKVQHRWMPTTN